MSYYNECILIFRNTDFIILVLSLKLHQDLTQNYKVAIFILVRAGCIYPWLIRTQHDTVTFQFNSSPPPPTSRIPTKSTIFDKFNSWNYRFAILHKILNMLTTPRTEIVLIIRTHPDSMCFRTHHQIVLIGWHSSWKYVFFYLWNVDCR